MGKTKLEIGDKIQRFEVMLTKEYDSLYEIISVTKTLAKTENKTFKRELHYDTAFPKTSKNKIIARVYTKDPQTWSTPDYFLVESNNHQKVCENNKEDKLIKEHLASFGYNLGDSVPVETLINEIIPELLKKT